MTTEAKGFAEVNGTKLYYEVAGEGHPLVLIHGGLLDMKMWDGQFAEFAQYYRVIRYDVRGFGKSKMTDIPYSHTRDLYGLLDFLGIKKAYLLGLSLGGSIAVDFTLEHPEMVDALILVAASVSGYDNFSEDAQEMGERVEAAVEERNVPKLFEIWANAPMMPQAQENPQAHQRYREILSDYSFVHYLNPAPREELEPPAIGRLSEIRIPTLVIVGDQDTLDITGIAELFEAGMIDVKKVTLPGMRHMINLERPEIFNRLVLSFLRRL